ARDRFRRAEMERAALDLAFEVGAADRRPAAFGANAVMHGLIARPVFLARLFVSYGDVARRMHSGFFRRAAELLEGARVEIGQGAEALGIAADDGESERQVVACGADDGFGAAADADPRFELSGLDRRKDALLRQRRPRMALPAHGIAPEQRRKQVKLLFEQ